MVVAVSNARRSFKFVALGNSLVGMEPPQQQQMGFLPEDKPVTERWSIGAWIDLERVAVCTRSYRALLQLGRLGRASFRAP